MAPFAVGLRTPDGGRYPVWEMAVVPTSFASVKFLRGLMKSSYIAIVVTLGVAVGLAFAAQPGGDAGAAETAAYRYESLKRDVEELRREDERLGSEIDRVTEDVQRRIEDIGVSFKTLNIVVLIFSILVASVVAVLGYRQGQSVKELKRDYYTTEELIRRIEADARQTVSEMKALAAKVRQDAERAAEEVTRAKELYGKAEELLAWLEERSTRADTYVKDIEEMKRVVKAAAAELPPLRAAAENPEGIKDVLRKYPALREYTDKLYREAMRGEVTAEDALLDLERALFYAGELEKALDVAELLTEKYPAHPEYHVYKSNVLQWLHRFDEALSAAEDALALDPKYVRAYQTKNNIFIEMGLFNEGLRAAEKALALNPDSAEAYQTLANAYNVQGRYEEALAAADKAIELQPDLQVAHFTRSICLLNLGRAGEGLAAGEKSIALHPDRPTGYVAKSLALYLLKRYEEALAYADKAAERTPVIAAAYLAKALALKDLGRYDEAEAAADEGVERGPNFTDSYLVRAGIYALTANKEKMLADLERAFAIWPSRVDATRREVTEGAAFFRPLGDGSDFDAFQKDPDFRRLVYPE